MAITVVQSAVPVTQNVTAPSVAFSTNVTAGSLLLAYIYVRDVTLASVTDTQSNTWVLAGNPTPGNFHAPNGNLRQGALLYAENAKVGATTVTGHSAGGTATCDMMIAEVSGFTTTGLLENISYTYDDTNTALSSGAIATARNANALIFAGVVTRDAITAGSSGDGYTILRDGAGFDSNSSKYKVVAATGTQSAATWTSSGIVGDWMVIASFASTAAVGTLGQYVTHLGGRGAGW